MTKKLMKKHAVMMEYVIVAVLIAAAVVVAVLVFGRTVKTEFNVASESMVDASAAEKAQKQLKSNVADNVKKADEHAKAINDYDGVKDGSSESK